MGCMKSWELESSFPGLSPTCSVAVIVNLDHRSRSIESVALTR